MKRVFRSIINVRKSGTPTIEASELKKNYRSFLTSKIEPEDPSHIKIYQWIEAHYRDYEEIPSIELLFERAQKNGDENVMASLKEIALETPYISSDYQAIIKEKFEEQNRDKFQSLLTKTWQVVSSGLKVKKKTIQGMTSAIDFFLSESRKFRFRASTTKTEADIRSTEVGMEVTEAYDKVKRDPSTTKGLYTFIDKIDDSVRGFKPGDLVMVAGFVGQGKTTLSANLAYNGIMQGLNGVFVAMEMNYEDMTNIFYCLHTSNPMWLSHPKFKNLVGKISFEKIIYGELSEIEEEFFKAAAQDFCNNPDYGRLYVWQPDEKLTPSALDTKLEEYNSTLQDSLGLNLDYVVVDYIGLMVADKDDRYGDFNVDLNNIIKRLKNTAMTFDGGRRLITITPFQVNRDGWREAEKNDGIYKLTALSSANEAERTSDLVFTIYFNDEMKRNGTVKIGCLKHRRGGGFSAFESRLDFTSRHWRNIIEKPQEDDNLISEIPLDA